ncbi:type II toxin-antitoxin system VapC family toxin [bacterium]|nr:type II toxin-antitoxin system VapC family toxin [bacterium]
MKIGLDTGVLINIAKKDNKALQLAKDWREKRDILVLSSISIAEILRYFHKQELGLVKAGHSEAVPDKVVNNRKMGMYKYIDKLIEAFEIVDVNITIAKKAASLSHGTGIHLLDSLILTTMLEKECDAFYTYDSDFSAYKGKKIKIKTL